jgi:hypothetical protein
MFLRPACLSSLVLLAWSAYSAQTPRTAIIVDTQGKQYAVEALEAEYSANGNWIGRKPRTVSESLHVRVVVREDRITTNDQYEYKFASIRGILFERPERESPRVRIDFLDGSSVLLTSKAMEKVDAKGVRVSLPVDSYDLEPEANFSIDGFRGRAKAASGKVGEFRIDYAETRSIDFR